MSKPIKRPLMSFCPKCETILKKHIEANSVVLLCRNCGYSEILHESIPHSRISPKLSAPDNEKTVGNDNKSKREKPLGSPKISHERATHPFQTENEQDKLNTLKQEILLAEIKKNTFSKSYESYTGPKKSEMIIEVLYLLQRIQELKYVYEFFKNKRENDEEDESTGDIFPIETKTEGGEKTFLVDGSKKALVWINSLYQKIGSIHPELNLVKTKDWANLETEIEHFNVCFIYPDHNKIYLITRTAGNNAERLAPLLFQINADDDVEGALTAVHKSAETVQKYLQKWLSNP
jgi:DNA-directed RNA polymerase subunit M/transcription elongation factor TFIIS